MGEAITWKFDDTFYPQAQFLFTRTQGTVTYYELLQHPEIFMRYKGFRSGLHILYDFHAVTHIDVQDKLLVDSVKLINSRDYIPVEAKTAFVLPEGAQDVMCNAVKICEALCQTRVEHRAFTTYTQAMAFLERPLTLLG